MTAAMALLATAAGQALALPAFRAKEVAIIPVGPDSAQIAAAECEDCCQSCELGFAFLGLNGALYVYDYGHGNLKVLRPSDGKYVSSTLPGVVAQHPGQGRVYDGAADAAGNVFLIADRGTATDRFAIYALAAGELRWQFDAFDEPSFGQSHISPGVPSLEGVRMVAGPESTITLHDLDERRSPGLLIGKAGRLVPAAARTWVSPGLPLPRGGRAVLRQERMELEGTTGGRYPAVYGGFLGFDGDANAYYVAFRPGPPYVLERYDRSGHLTARTQLPRHEFWKTFAGKGYIFVTHQGDLLELWPTRQSLRLIRWRVGS